MSPTLVALGLGLLAYVLPVDRVLLQLGLDRERTPPLHVQATLAGIGEDWPEQVQLDLHPELGFRVAGWRGSSGERWLFAAGNAQAGTRLPAPPWIPDLDILSLRDPEILLARLEDLGVDLEQSELARCGEFDCFVLGGRGPGPQVWVEKDRFEVIAVRTARGGVEYSRWRSWKELRFPAEIRVYDEFGTIGTLSVLDVSAARSLGDEDFSPQWVDAAGENPNGAMGSRTDPASYGSVSP